MFKRLRANKKSSLKPGKIPLPIQSTETATYFAWHPARHQASPAAEWLASSRMGTGAGCTTPGVGLITPSPRLACR